MPGSAKSREAYADRWFRKVALSPKEGVLRALMTGLAAAVVGLAARLALQGAYTDAGGAIVFLPGILAATLWAGRTAGFTALALSVLAALALAGFTEAEGPALAAKLAVFAVVAAFGVIMAASLRQSLRSLDRTVTALRESDSVLTESETRFRLVSENAPVMLWMSDPQGACVYLNKALHKFWNAPENLSKFDWSETLHPEDAARVMEAAGAAAAAREGFETEARYRRSDGQWRLVTTTAQPRFDADGAFVGMIGVNLDVTDARCTQAALRESEAELAAMVENAAAGIVKATLDGRILKVNDRFCELMEMARDDLLGKRTVDLTHPDDVAESHRIREAALSNQHGASLQKRYIRPDGSTFWALTSIRMGRSGEEDAPWLMVIITDISEAKATEAALRESEVRFRLLADTAPAPVWMTDAEGAVEFANEALVIFYGRPAQALLGHIWKDTLHPEDRERVADIQSKARPDRLPYGFEARFLNASGEYRWMRVNVKPRFDLDGVFLGYVGMSFDVTESHEALERLARDRRRQTFLLHLSDRLRDLANPEEIMAEVEAAVGDALGVHRVGYGEVDPAQDMVLFGRDWTDGVMSARGVWARDAVGAALVDDLSEGLIVRIRDVREDPRTQDALETFERLKTRALVRVPIMRGGRMRAFLYVHDSAPRDWLDAEVSLIAEAAERTWAEIDRARAEADLRESEERFRDIADTAPVLIWVTRQDRVRSFVNQAYVAYMGADYETVRTADWREYLHPDDQDRVLRESMAGEKKGKPFTLEARYRHRDGEYRWLRSFSRPRFNASGEVIGFVGVAFDVNEERKAEADLKRINELLAERVSEALAEKAQAEADLLHAQRMEAVGRLTGGVAHDFNNLLTVVIGALDMILKSPDNAPRRQKMAEAALAAARRGERLTHQLLAFSRRQALRPEASDLNDIIRESEPLLKRAVGEAVDFRLKLKRGRAMARVDAAHFEAALLNLVVNARDAVGERGAIQVRTSACTVTAEDIGEMEPGDYVCVVVADDGPGIDPEIVDRVFEPFFTTKAVGKGTGLGLSQVYGFAKQSGGGARVVSAEGGGAEVWMYLPRLARSPRKPEPAPVARSAPSVSGKRILLVEDDASVAAVAMDLLRGFGMDVVATENADQAITALEAGRFDVMLTDIIMPGGRSGVDLAREVSERWPGTRIMMTTGYAGDDVQTVLKDAPWAVLTKPYSTEQLRNALGETLAQP